MPYYDTIEADLRRAKEILAKGDHRAELEHELTDGGLRHFEDASKNELRKTRSGAISGADIYAAYKLLESFVAEIERLRAAYATLHDSVRDIYAEGLDIGMHLGKKLDE